MTAAPFVGVPGDRWVNVAASRASLGGPRQWGCRRQEGPATSPAPSRRARGHRVGAVEGPVRVRCARRSANRRRRRQPHHRSLERQVGHRRTHRRDVAGRGVHRDPNTLGTHHQRRVTAGFDGGVTRSGLQRRAQHVDLDEVPVRAPGPGAGPQIGLTDEAGDEHRCGPVVNLCGRADLVDVACVHHRDPVAHRQRLLLVVGHVDERDPDLALNAFELELHHLAQLEVECAERFVEQQRAGIVDQCPGQRHALLLAAGQLGGSALGEVGQPHDLQQLVDALADRAFSVGLVHLPAARPVGDVVPHRHVRKQRIVLKDRVHVALVRRDP